MDIEKLETAALKLDFKSRAKLAQRLLVSLEELSEQENAELWAAEALLRDSQMDADPDASRPADEVLREVRSQLK